MVAVRRNRRDPAGQRVLPALRHAEQLARRPDVRGESAGVVGVKQVQLRNHLPLSPDHLPARSPLGEQVLLAQSAEQFHNRIILRLVTLPKQPRNQAERRCRSSGCHHCAGRHS
eukprot:scaffold6196_cov113-Isochrysis_galbana.AAC.5